MNNLLSTQIRSITDWSSMLVGWTPMRLKHAFSSLRPIHPLWELELKNAKKPERNNRPSVRYGPSIHCESWSWRMPRNL